MRLRSLVALLIPFVFSLSAAAKGKALELDPTSMTPTPTAEQEIPTQAKTTNENLDGVKIESVDSSQDIPARTVRISLKSVVDAQGYQVEILPSEKIWEKPWIFQLNQDTTTLRIRLNPGRYSIRTRSLAQNNEKGSWSTRRFFWIGFKAIDMAYPTAGLVIEPKGTANETLFFQWPMVKGASWYFFQLKDAEGKPLRYVLTKESFLKSSLQVKQDYQWAVTPMKKKDDYQKLIRNPNVKLQKFSIGEPAAENKGTLVKVGSIKNVNKYEFEVVSIDVDDAETDKTPSYFQSFDPEYRFRLPPGGYELRVRGLRDQNENTAWSSPTRFFIKYNLPVPLNPASGQTVEAYDDVESKVLLRWTPDPRAEIYRVYIYDANKKLMATYETKKPGYIVKLAEKRKYYWVAKAYSKNEPLEEPVTREISSEFQVGNYIKLALNSAEEISQFYAWARQIASLESYVGYNYDNNAIVKQELIGGETELAVGYWWRKSGLGVLAHGSLNGFNFRGETYFYGNTGLHLGYRHLLENGDRFRIWGGIVLNESPEILTYPYTKEVIFSKVKNWGPQIQAAYLKGFTDKWGAQLAASIYRSQWGLESPNGLEQQATLSYRLSLMASYANTKQWRTSFGYTYKVDQFSYNTTDPINIPNTGKIQGHYFSALLEIALQDKQK